MAPSAQVLSILQAMGKGGKSANLNINVLEDALKELGWAVEESTGAAKLDDSDQLSVLLSKWLKEHKGYAWGYPGVKEPKEFWFPDEASTVAALRDLPSHAEKAGTKGPDDPQRGKLYFGTVSGPIHTTSPQDRWILTSELWWLGTAGYVFRTPKGATVSVALPVDARGRVADPASMKLSGFWTWGYKNGLQEAAQVYLSSGGDAEIEKHRQEKELALRSLDNTGTCPACFQNVKLVPRTQAISRHGWSVMGFGGWKNLGAHHQGQCFGVGYQPFELSKLGTVRYRESLNDQEKRILAEIERLKREPDELFETRGRKTVTIAKGHDHYVHVLQIQINNAKANHKGISEAMRTLDAKISAWEQKPLPGTRTASLRSRVIRLAHAVPVLRQHLVPILRRD